MPENPGLLITRRQRAGPALGSRRLALEEALDPVEKAQRLRRGFLVALPLEGLEQLALFAREILGRLHLDLDVHIAGDLRAQHRHALALEAELLAALAALGHLHARLLAVDGGNFDLPAQRRRGHRDRHAAEDVGAVALEELVRLDRQEDVEIAGRSAAQAGLALAGQPYLGAVLDARRNVDGQGALSSSPGPSRCRSRTGR